MEATESVQVELTAKDMADISVLQSQTHAEHAELDYRDDLDAFLRRVMLAGIEKLREEQAAASYALMAKDPDYREYHDRRRADRARR